MSGTDASRGGYPVLLDLAGRLCLVARRRSGAGGEGTGIAGGRRLRDRLATDFGPEWRTVAQIAAALRRRRLTPVERTAYNSEVVRQFPDDGLPALVAARDTDGIDRLLKARCGSGCSLAGLGVSLRKG